jgi:predicted site-specific integrase-resolvase
MKLLNAQAAADFLGVHRHTIRKYVQTGVLKPVHQESNIILFERKELERRKAEIELAPVKRGRPAKPRCKEAL